MAECLERSIAVLEVSGPTDDRGGHKNFSVGLSNNSGSILLKTSHFTKHTYTLEVDFARYSNRWSPFLPE